MGKDIKDYKSALPMSLFHGKNPNNEDLELGMRLACAGKLIPNRKSVAEPMRAVYEMVQVFAEKHAKYYGHRLQDWRKALGKNRGILGCCSKAVSQAELLRTTAENYLEAQFWFFDQSFARTPTYAEIAASGAILRYKKWRVAVVHEGIPTTTVSVATIGKRHTKAISSDVQQRYEEKVFQRMLSHWGTEEALWAACADNIEDIGFSEAFLQSRPVWKAFFGS